MNEGIEELLVTYADQVAADEDPRPFQVFRAPSRAADFAQLPEGLSPQAAKLLLASGYEKVYRHQKEAIESVLAGQDTMIVTGTNSGKSLCFGAPLLNICLSEPRARALLLFPTKALAQDQEQSLTRLFGDSGLRAATYDADTPRSQRSQIRNGATAILTNPDMLHFGILPGHENWGKFLKSLRLIVLDEMHQYRGVFGSHIAWVLRRLLRLCEFHGSRPVIVAAAATIGNGEAAFQQLTGRTPRLIEGNGAPSAERTLILTSPGLKKDGTATSPNWESAKLLADLVESGAQGLVFSRSRSGSELVLRYTREVLEGRGRGTNLVDSYRGGYTAKERRSIESAIFKGKLKGLSSTNALELGINIGTLDAVVLNGYPGTLASFLQQAGRAGRGERAGYAFYIAHEDPLEQFLLRDPSRLLDGQVEKVSLSLENSFIVRQHLRCAAFERPISASELGSMSTTALEVAEQLDLAGELQFSAGRFFYPGFQSPTPEVSLRGAGVRQIMLLLNGELLGTVEYPRALQVVHQGAVYLHRGLTYVVDELDLKNSTARVHQEDTTYYTQSMVQSVLKAERVLWSVGRFSFVYAEVSDTVTGYQTKSFDRGIALGLTELDLPTESFETFSFRADFALPPAEAMEEFISALHGVEHALMAVAPLICGCDRGDIGSAWFSITPDKLVPSIFVFDRAPGGVGLAEMLYRARAEWLQTALELLKECPCETGCPNCLLSTRCEVNNESLSKAGAIVLLEDLVFAAGLPSDD